jgi:hypothetical protein
MTCVGSGRLEAGDGEDAHECCVGEGEDDGAAMHAAGHHASGRAHQVGWYPSLIIRRSPALAEIETLDPATDWERIGFLSTNYDFPWDVEQSLSLAFFKTYGIPSISALLDKTGEFRHRPQKRYDDTKLILAEIFDQGMDSERGREANRRMNGMHGRYEISNDDYLYVLSTFVLVPGRWNDKFGWRPYTERERRAGLNYWRELGRRMNIRGIPNDVDELDRWSRAFEMANSRFTESNRHVADDTLNLFLSWYPRPLRPVVRLGVMSLLEDYLLDAFGYKHPPRWFRGLVELTLRIRARVIRRLPRRRRPRLITKERMRSYPGGYRPDELGVMGPVGGPASTKP